MRNVTKAMAIEFVSKGHLSLLYVISPLAIPILWWFMFQLTELDLRTPEMLYAIARLVSINSLFIAVLFFSTAMIQPRQFLLPLTTTQLLTYQLLYALVVSVTVSVETTLFQNWIFQQHFPILTPMLIGPVGGLCFLAAVCATQGSNWKWVILPLVIAALASWYITRFVLVSPERVLESPSIGDIALLLVLAVASFWTLTWAVMKNRCGDAMNPMPMPASLVRYWDSLLSRQRFHSPAQALFWIEWQKFGWLVPILAIGVTIISVINWYVSDGDPHHLLIGYAQVWVNVGTIGGMIVALRTVIVMREKARADDLGVPTFLATMPVRNRSFAYALFKVIGANGLFLFGIWLAGFAAAYFVTPRFGLLTSEVLPGDFRWWQLPGSVVFYWVVASLFSTLLLTGNRNLITGFSSSLCVGCLISIILGRWIPYEMRTPIFQIVGNLGGCAAVAITLLAHWKALRGKLIPNSTAILCTLIWCALSTLWIFTWEQPPPGNISFFPLGMGMITLAVAPFAMTPIAISWNRCR